MKVLFTILISGLPLFVQAQVSSQSQSSRNYTPYTQPFDLKTYERVSTQKQAVFDRNYQTIVNQVNFISRRLQSLREYHENAATSISNQLDRFVEHLNQLSIDYSDSRNCKRVLENLDKFNLLINNTYSDLERAANIAQAPTVPVTNTNRQAEIHPMTNLYESANGDSKVLHTFKSGEMVLILGEDPSFYLIKAAAYQGYIRRSMVKRFAN